MQHRKSGFTLIELLVVLAVVTIVSSITFGAFRSISDGNKRTTCQSNMAQIYKSVRLYSQDFDGEFPYLNPVKIQDPPVASPTATDYVAEAQPNTPEGGMGLWALYTSRPQTTNLICANNDVVLPLADDNTQIGLSGYVRNPNIFHCPADRFEKVVQYQNTSTATACTATPNPVITAQFSFVDATGLKRINPAYLSYQTEDDVVAVGPKTTYSSFRQPEPIVAGKRVRVRQISAFQQDNGSGTPTSIIERPIQPATVITWCRFHRSLDDQTVSTGATVVGKRNFDNVLFSDGTVQSIPAEQEVSNSPGNPAPMPCTGWQRVPRNKAENMQDATTCTP